MPTYTQDFDYLLHASARVTHKLVIVEEEPSLSKHQANLTIYIERTNSGREHDGNQQYLQLKINDEIVYDNTSSCRVLGENSSDSVFNQTYTVDYDSNGTKNFKIEATYKSERVSILTDLIWGTIATAEISGSLTPIDLSAPTVSDISVVADRYGSNAYASFKVSHSSYELKEVEFKLKGLTKDQAKCRDSMYDNSQSAYVNKNDYGKENESYYIQLTRIFPIGQSLECHYPLDDGNDGAHPLESGQSYPYEIYAVSENNVEITVEGYLNVPQKVTGITCEPQLDLMLGQTTELEYTVYPSNAEEKSVTFYSTDSSVAMVDENSGVITAIGDGVCQITVTTLDGGSPDAVSGFSAACTVNILNKDNFPSLNEIRYLTVREISKLAFACTFLRENLIGKGITVPDLSIVTCEGKSHPVKEIKSLLETIESNCKILKIASFSVYPTSSLAEQQDIINQNVGSNWYISVNEWVRFLNELNSLIEKEV